MSDENQLERAITALLSPDLPLPPTMRARAVLSLFPDPSKRMKIDNDAAPPGMVRVARTAPPDMLVPSEPFPAVSSTAAVLPSESVRESQQRILDIIHKRKRENDKEKKSRLDALAETIYQLIEDHDDTHVFFDPIEVIEKVVDLLWA